MRLIDADALIEFCAERWIPLNIDAVNMQPTVQQEPQWIPCSKKLPEEAGYYITSSEYGGVTVDFYYDHFWNSRKNAYKVLAWMPLPKIYKPNK